LNVDFSLVEEEDEEKDPDTRTQEEINYENFFGGSAKLERAMKALQDRPSLHHATLTLPDIECVGLYEIFKKD
jgi:hypothetical protein